MFVLLYRSAGISGIQVREQTMEKDHKYTKCILANICMVEDGFGNILVQERTKKDWPGLTFPGGHVEKGESLDASVKREVLEETGLVLDSVLFCGIIEWPWDDESRYLGLVYKSSEFHGQLISSLEGKVYWMKKSELFLHQTSLDLDKIFQIAEERPYPDKQKAGLGK